MTTSNIQMIKSNGGISFEWSSYEDFLPDLKQLSEDKPGVIQEIKKFGHQGGGYKRWFGHDDGFDGVVDATKNGWPELREKLEEMMVGVELELPQFPTLTKQRRRKRHHDDYGDTLDIKKVWNGQLDRAWERPIRTEKLQFNTKRITLCFDIASNAYVSSWQALWRAALCMLLTDGLARAGRVFEIWVSWSVQGPFTGQGVPARAWVGMPVKRTEEPLVLDRLCSMVSVGFLRTAGFVGLNCGPYAIGYGYGRALNHGVPHTLAIREKAGEVVLRIGECYSKDAALREYERAWNQIEGKADEPQKDIFA